MIVLLGGRTGAEVEGHDWEAILRTLGWLRYDVLLGRITSFPGSVLMLVAWWGEGGRLWAGSGTRARLRWASITVAER